MEIQTGFSTGEFKDGKIFLYDTLMVDTWHDEFAKTHRTVQHREHQCILSALVTNSISALARLL